LAEKLHHFHAAAFVENFSLKDCARAFARPRVTAYELQAALGDGGDVFAYGFGAVVFRDVDAATRSAQLERLRATCTGVTNHVVEEEFTVREDPTAEIGIVDGVFRLDRMTTARAGVIALTVGQSAAMEYYEKIVVALFARTTELVDRLEKHGTVPLHTRPMHQFIGRAIGTRTEVLAVLHLLDKPDATWDDPGMDDIYEDLRAEFDLIDRYEALESKMKGVQEALELVLDVARDRRLVFLEAMIVLLIVLEIILGIFRVF
jgi:required for meiotic nuclear division protein 1